MVVWLHLALGFALLACSMWIVVPAPTRALLPLGVGAPELSPLLALFGGALTLVGVARIRSRDDRWKRVVATVCSAAVFALASIPLLQFQRARRDVEHELSAAFGRDTTLASARTTGGRTGVFSLRDLFVGISRGRSVTTYVRPFSMSAGVALTMRIDSPEGAPADRRPVIVQVYGGAWQRGTPDDFAAFSEYFASSGYVVFSVDYRHAPAFTYPAQRDDIRTALQWINANAAAYHADTSHMVLLGRSAGAQLAMLAAYPDGANVRGVVSLYGPVDLLEGYRTVPSPDPLNVRAVEEAFLAGTPAQRPAAYRDASPITYASRSVPPTLLLYGGRDHIVEARFGRQLRDTLRSHGNTVVHIELAWAEHAFDAVPNGLGGQLSLYTIERFLHAVNRASSGTNSRPGSSANNPGGTSRQSTTPVLH